MLSQIRTPESTRQALYDPQKEIHGITLASMVISTFFRALPLEAVVIGAALGGGENRRGYLTR